MHRKFFKKSMLAFCLLTAGQESRAQKESLQIKNMLDSFSYAVGMNLAQNMKDQGVTSVNGAAFLRAMQDIFDEKTTLMTNETANMKIQETIQAFMAKKVNAAKEKEDAFFAENGKKNGVISLPNGMQYKILKAGPDGMKPTVADTVVVNYKGTLINGSEFDNSFKRGEPATFPLGGVIKGWTEILQLMTKGASWEVYIPFSLAYGDRAMGPNLPAYSTLIFQIDLLDIKPAVKN